MSNIKRTRAGRYWLAWLVVLVVLLLVLRGCFWRPGTAYAGAHFDRGQNAAWLSVDWSKDTHTPKEIRALADELERREIRTLYVYASYVKPGNRFNPTYDHAADFVRVYKALQPNATVQAWIGIPLDKSSLWGKGYVRIDDASVRRLIADFCRELVYEFGFDGVHLDPEPIPDGDEDTLQLLDEVRAAIGRDKVLSLSTRNILPVWNDAPWWPALGLWRASYYRRIAGHVDEIAVMTYDSGLRSPWLYE